ncbi:hypothetical protein [Alteribacillus sp. HJP-4]|uniref:hypothetical protein n=1 Tax=Alteribacillus sp. HJP-4 TaxID=2775394 RepID=UPI0035CD1262
MDRKTPSEFDRYTAAELDDELVNKVTLLENDLRTALNKDVVVIAYEESRHNPS